VTSVPAPAMEFMTPAISADTTAKASLIESNAGDGANRGNVAGGKGPVDCLTRET
jgi:hypothetical protein